MLMPLYGFIRGDSLGLLVLVQDDDTVEALGQSLLQAAAVRIAPHGKARVFREGLELDPTLSVSEAGFSALDRVDLRLDEPSNGSSAA
jgi:hypothetical protein